MNELRRDLGLLDAVGIGFGAIIGAGIFVVTGVGAGLAGPALIVALLLAAVAATCNALSSAELAASFPRAGGTYEYGYELLSPAAGFAAGWMFLASKTAAAGTVAIGLAAYLHAVLPASPRIIAVAAIVAFTALNYFGIRRSSRANLFIVAVSIGALLLFIAAGIPAFDAANLRPFAPYGSRAVMEAAAIMFFAYTGYARVATLAEEVHEPARTIPRAILITILGAVALYLAVATIAIGSVGAARLADDPAPLQSAARAFPVRGIDVVVSIGGVTAMLGVILSQLLGLSRMGFAMARRADLPRFMAGVHPRYGVPGNAVLVIGAIAAVVAATGTLKGVASAAAFTILVYYAIANVAALKLRGAAQLYPRIIPLLGLVSCIALALSLSWQVIVTGGVLLAAGFVLRALLSGGRNLRPD